MLKERKRPKNFEMFQRLGHIALKGKPSWNKGKKLSEKHRRNLSESHKGLPSNWKGHKHTEEAKRKMSEAAKGRISPMKGKKHSDKSKQKMSKSLKGRNSWNKGKSWSDETKEKMSKVKIGKYEGKDNPNWQGGTSFEPYGLEFNENLREVIRNRDRRKCQVCEKTELENGKKLDCHHIDYNKQNNNPNNLITLCHSCHCKTNNNQKYWKQYFQNRWKKQTHFQ